MAQTQTVAMRKVRIVVKQWIAKSNQWPHSIDGVVEFETQKAIKINGHASVDAPSVCSHCGRALTHPVSKIIGIGPICAGDMGLGRYDRELTQEEIAYLRSKVMEITFDGWIPKSAIKDMSELGSETVEVETTIADNSGNSEASNVFQSKYSPKDFQTGRKMDSRFDSKCELCGDSIKSGSSIMYVPGKGAAHFACVNSEVVASAPQSLLSPYLFKGNAVRPSLYDGNCKVCGKSYKKNDLVIWVKDTGCAHNECVHTEASRNFKDSFLETAEMIIDGLNGTPYPFQRAGIQYAINNNGRVIIGDEMGLGKTIQALGYIQANPNARPAIIFQPAAVKINWERETKKWLSNTPNNRVTVLNSSPEAGVKLEANGIYIINYDIASKWKDLLISVNPQIVVLDECHYLKNPEALRTKAIVGGIKKEKGKQDIVIPGIASNSPSILALSGTPLVNRPIELWTILHLLRPDIFSSFTSYAFNYCGAYKDAWGLKYGTPNIEGLFKILRQTCMIRRLKKDVLKELPEKVRTSIPLEIANRSEYNFASKQFKLWMKENGGKEVNRAEALVKIEKLKQLAYKGKAKAIIDWVENFLETGEKLVVFAHHQEVISEISNHFKGLTVTVTGEDSKEEKQRSVDSFQNDQSTRLIICSIKAASIGLTLTAASNVAFAELLWTPGEHQQSEDRCHRIGQTDSVTAWYLIGENTIEEEIAAIIDEKAKILAGVLDGQKVDPNQSILGALIDRMAA